MQLCMRVVSAMIRDSIEAEIRIQGKAGQKWSQFAVHWVY